jgi:hypothetical protein
MQFGRAEGMPWYVRSRCGVAGLNSLDSKSRLLVNILGHPGNGTVVALDIVEIIRPAYEIQRA